MEDADEEVDADPYENERDDNLEDVVGANGHDCVTDELILSHSVPFQKQGQTL